MTTIHAGDCTTDCDDCAVLCAESHHESCWRETTPERRREADAIALARHIGERVYIDTMGGQLAGALRGVALSVSWTLLTDVRGAAEKARVVGAVALDVPTINGIDTYSGAERVWPGNLIHPLDLEDGRYVIDETGRILTA